MHPVPDSTSAAATPTSTVMLRRYRDVREFSQAICQPLKTEDFVIQSMPDVSLLAVIYDVRVGAEVAVDRSWVGLGARGSDAHG